MGGEKTIPNANPKKIGSCGKNENFNPFYLL